MSAQEELQARVSYLEAALRRFARLELAVPPGAAPARRAEEAEDRLRWARRIAQDTLHKLGVAW